MPQFPHLDSQTAFELAIYGALSPEQRRMLVSRYELSRTNSSEPASPRQERGIQPPSPHPLLHGTRASSTVLFSPESEKSSIGVRCERQGCKGIAETQPAPSYTRKIPRFPMCFRESSRIHLARGGILGTGDPESELCERAALKQRIFIEKSKGDPVMLGQVLLPGALLCLNPETKEYAWQVNDDQRFEPATQRSLGSEEKLWPLFRNLCRIGVDVERVRPEHVLVNDFARESCWAHFNSGSSRIEDIFRLVHVWKVSDEEQNKAQASQLSLIISRFLKSLPKDL